MCRLTVKGMIAKFVKTAHPAFDKKNFGFFTGNQLYVRSCDCYWYLKSFNNDMSDIASRNQFTI